AATCAGCPQPSPPPLHDALPICLRPRIVAVLAAPSPAPSGAAPRGRVVVIGSGDFASDRYARNSPTNIVLVQNDVGRRIAGEARSEEDTSELQSPDQLVGRLLLQ